MSGLKNEVRGIKLFETKVTLTSFAIFGFASFEMKILREEIF